MFKNPFQVAISFSLVALLYKLGLLYLNLQHSEIHYVVYGYLLLVLCTAFFGIRSNIALQKEKTTFGEDFRAGARTASYFAIMVGGITYMYYTQIDPEFFEVKKAISISEYKTHITEKVDELGIVGAKELFQNKVLTLNTIYSPGSQTSYTLFGLVFIGLFQAGVFALLIKKMPGFRK